MSSENGAPPRELVRPPKTLVEVDATTGREDAHGGETPIVRVASSDVRLLQVDRIGRARLVAAVLVAAYFVLLVSLGGHSAWGRLGVPPGELTFLDLRSVTTASECDRRGIDVLELNPCDPLRRPANYPRVWVKLSLLDVDEGDTVPLALGMIVLALLAALAVIPRSTPPRDGAVYGAALCSPAVMLGVERGNVDLLIFALLVAAALALQRGRAGAIVAHALVLTAAILKLFPIFAVGMLVRHSPRRALMGAGTVLALFGVYALATLDDIRTIGRVVPRTDWYSYGMRTFGVWWSNAVPPFSTRVWDTILLVGLLAVLVALRPRLRRLLSADERSPEAVRDLDMFWSGAGIYVCTFALFQSFDYRLIFLLFTLPQLLRWTRERSTLAIMTLGLVLATLWLASPWTGVPVAGWIVSGWEYVSAFRPIAHYRSLSAAATAQLLLAAGLLAGLVATFPRSLARSVGRRRTGGSP
jgi:hypothetical protein